jgi:SAM-dependent methyltransferase
MVEKLFSTRIPQASDTLLDPGCGTGVFIQGVVDWCARNRAPVPRIVGIEADKGRLGIARATVGRVAQVTLLNEDFLIGRADRFDFVVGNPPYVPITDLSFEERTRYRQRYRSARGRFDLYLLFFEQALSLLKPEGRLVFVTPEKYLYVETAEPLRRYLAEFDVQEVELIDEAAFGDLVTYPTVTTVARSPYAGLTRIALRDGGVRTVRIDAGGKSWLSMMNGTSASTMGPMLAEAFVRISCGVATGADAVYVLPDGDVTDALRRFAYPTLAGRKLEVGGEVRTTHSMLIPYATTGALLPERQLGPLGDYLREPERYERLIRRTCARRKPWYAFHENPPLREILRPKILCKDIGLRPWFVIDQTGEIVPRHSVYYLVPKEPSMLFELCDYLNSPAATEWLQANCQRAANGFLRLQSHVLKRMPMPERFVDAPSLVLAH